MSIWTHVAGIIRIDSLMPALFHKETWVTDIPEAMLADGEVPTGSEGPLRVTARVAASDRTSIARGYIVIDGDLRDFNNPRIIQRWLDSTKLPHGYFIRQGVVLVDVECRDSVIYTYADGDKPDTGHWVENL